MPRYVDVDALKEQVESINAAELRVSDYYSKRGNEQYATAHHVRAMLCTQFFSLIDDAPTADVAPVRHGRWCTTDAFPHRVYCSVCHKTYIPNYHWQVWQDEYGEGGLPRDYCPNCGAIMDGGADE